MRKLLTTVFEEETLPTFLLLGLDVVENDVKGGAELAIISDDSHRAADSLADGAILSQLGKANPLTELLALIALDKVHVALGTQGLNELGVLVVVAVLGEDAEAGGATVQGLGALVKATAEPVVHKRRLEHLLKSIDDAHLATSLFVLG